MATLSFARVIHRRRHGFLLRMDVSLRCGKINVTGQQIGEGVRVHVRRPTCQASMAEGIEGERLNIRQRYGLVVLLL